MTNGGLDRGCGPIALALVFAGVLVAPKGLHAQTSPKATDPDTAPSTVIRYDLALDLAVTGGALAVVVSFELLTPTLATSCRWCDRNSDGSNSLNGFDSGLRKALRWHDTRTADTLSTVFSFGLAPLAGIGIGVLVAARDDRLPELPADLLVVAESALLALDLTEVSKFAFARERPDIHARSPVERAARRSNADNLSFFSGHTTLAFALATSAGTIASMGRHRLAPLMWASGMLLAATSAYLRIAADRHYATDVLAGIVVGSGVGFSVPYFAHRPLTPGARLAAMPVEGGTGLMLTGVF